MQQESLLQYEVGNQCPHLRNESTAAKELRFVYGAQGAAAPDGVSFASTHNTPASDK